MVLPTSHLAAVLLLLSCLCCWGLWIYLSAVTVTRWRYELYYLDVCVGLLLTSLGIVFTFGSLGSDMTYGDRLLVAGLTAKALNVLGGISIALGNFFFLAGLSLRYRLSPVLSVVGALALSLTWVRFANGGTIVLPIAELERQCAIVIVALKFTDRADSLPANYLITSITTVFLTVTVPYLGYTLGIISTACELPFGAISIADFLIF